MGVYAVAWSLSRLRSATEDKEEDWEFQPILQVAKNVFSKQEAAQTICDAFEYTENYKAGWRLTGPPAVLEVTEETIADWTPYIEPPVANEVKRPPHLQLVPTQDEKHNS